MITGREPSWRNGLARKGLLIATTALPALLGCGHALAQDAATTLDPINVQDRVESAFGPVKGYVASKGSSGTKTDTPLIETPQSISVITKDQIEAQAIDNLGGVLRYTPGATGDLYGTDNRGLGLQLRGISNANETKLSFCFLCGFKGLDAGFIRIHDISVSAMSRESARFPPAINGWHQTAHSAARHASPQDGKPASGASGLEHEVSISGST